MIIRYIDYIEGRWILFYMIPFRWKIVGFRWIFLFYAHKQGFDK